MKASVHSVYQLRCISIGGADCKVNGGSSWSCRKMTLVDSILERECQWYWLILPLHQHWYWFQRIPLHWLIHLVDILPYGEWHGFVKVRRVATAVHCYSTNRSMTAWRSTRFPRRNAWDFTLKLDRVRILNSFMRVTVHDVWWNLGWIVQWLLFSFWKFSGLTFGQKWLYNFNTIFFCQFR